MSNHDPFRISQFIIFKTPCMHVGQFPSSLNYIGEQLRFSSLHTQYEPQHDKTNKMTCVPSEEGDLRCPHGETWGIKLPVERTAKTLISPGGCPG